MLREIHHFLKEKSAIYNRGYGCSLGKILGVIRKGIHILSLYGFKGLRISLSNRMTIYYTLKVNDKGIIRFHCSSLMSLNQAKNYLNWEPDTVNWIKRFAPRSVFFDIGANIGGYSFLAALYGCKCFCFEPLASNYNEIQKNLYINQSISGRVFALPVALDRETHISYFFIRELEAGAAKNAINKPEWWGGTFDTKFKQSILCYNLDDCIRQFSLPIPNHIKVDVDGNEENVLLGATETLKKDDLRSILVELPLKSSLSLEDRVSQRVVDLLAGFGFALVTRAENREITNFIFSK